MIANEDASILILTLEWLRHASLWVANRVEMFISVQLGSGCLLLLNAQQVASVIISWQQTHRDPIVSLERILIKQTIELNGGSWLTTTSGLNNCYSYNQKDSIKRTCGKNIFYLNASHEISTKHNYTHSLVSFLWTSLLACILLACYLMAVWQKQPM